MVLQHHIFVINTTECLNNQVKDNMKLEMSKKLVYDKDPADVCFANISYRYGNGLAPTAGNSIRSGFGGNLSGLIHEIFMN